MGLMSKKEHPNLNDLFKNLMNFDSMFFMYALIIKRFEVFLELMTKIFI